jgi:solute carrier family 34 (sodium-dependent phosphate cotransporter)
MHGFPPSQSFLNIHLFHVLLSSTNAGTSVTSTIVAVGQISNDDQFERAFAGATVNDVFNYLAVIILFPVEIITGLLNAITTRMVANIQLGTVERRNGFVRKYIRPVGEMVINQNRRVTDAVATGSGTCADFYPTECEDPENPTADTCRVGLIRCNDWGCPVFFESGADRNDDELAGFASFFIGVTILFICLGGLVFVLSNMLLGASTRVIQKATQINGYVAILIGTAITIAVQSSSITTATLTPLAGMGIIRLEEMFPLTLGANIGTTLTGMYASSGFKF